MFQDNSINCDVCDMWFHFCCVNISDEQKIPDENDLLLVKWECLFRFIYIALGYNKKEKVCIYFVLKILLNLVQV